MKKKYFKPTIERQTIFSYEGGYISFGKEHPRWLYLKDNENNSI